MYLFSSLSVWVHACDAMELKDEYRQKLDGFIDQLYVDIEKGKQIMLTCIVSVFSVGATGYVEYPDMKTRICHNIVFTCKTFYRRRTCDHL